MFRTYCYFESPFTSLYPDGMLQCMLIKFVTLSSILFFIINLYLLCFISISHRFLHKVVMQKIFSPAIRNQCSEISSCISKIELRSVNIIWLFHSGSLFIICLCSLGVHIITQFSVLCDLN